MIKALIVYIRCTLCFLFAINKHGKYYFAGKSLHKKTFRLPEKTFGDYLIVFRIFWRNNFFIFNKNGRKIEFKSGSAIWSVNNEEEKSRKEYVQHFTNEKIDNYISYTDLGCLNDRSIFFKIFFLLLSPFFIVFSFVFSLFLKNKYQYALGLQEVIEGAQLVYMCKQYNINELYIFCIYERATNYTTILLNRNNVKVNKVTSEVPLFLPNPEIIADKIITCFNYQNEEVEYFKNSMFFNNIELWGPEQILDNASKKSKNIINTKTIGFYSSAFWLRAKLGHIDLNLNLKENEELLLRTLIKVKNNNSNIIIQIYLHPLEKKGENVHMAIQYYKQIFKNCNFEFMDIVEKSSNTFHKTNIGISLFSTILFERLYLGYKTLIYPANLKGFPIPKSKISNICVYNYLQINNIISESINLTDKEYFKKYNIMGYSKKGVLLK